MAIKHAKPTQVRNGANLEDAAVLFHLFRTGAASPEILQTQSGSPPKRIASNVRRGITPLGKGARVHKTFTINPQLDTFLSEGVNENQNVQIEHVISEQLDKGVPASAFFNGLSGKTDPHSLPDDKASVVKDNLALQARFLRAARARPEFNLHRITVEHGVYKYDDVEEESSDPNDLARLASEGRAIGYSVKSPMGGETDLERTFMLAEYWMGFPFYERLIMDYHVLGTSVYLVTPNSHSGPFSRQLETRYNGALQSNSLMLLA